MAPKNDEDEAYRQLEGGSHSKLNEVHSQDSQQSSSHEPSQGNPWVVWPILSLAIFFGATSGPVMALMENANPISLVAWRHQVSTVLMLPSFIYEAKNLEAPEREKFWSLATLLKHLLTAFFLAGHYAVYSMALQQTSIPHCLFLMSTSPVFVAIFVKLSGGTLQPLELGGMFLGLLGIGIFNVGSATSENSSYYGDFLAVLAAIFLATYLMVAKSLRSWMPLYIFQWPMALYGSLMLSIGGMVSKGWFESEGEAVSGPFDWLRGEFFWPAIWLGAACGFLGQAGCSYVLKYSSPLVLPCALTFQPIIGSALSWLVGQTAVPELTAWIGGAVVLVGTTIVNIASARKKSQQAASGVERSGSNVPEETKESLLNNRS